MLTPTCFGDYSIGQLAAERDCDNCESIDRCFATSTPERDRVLSAQEILQRAAKTYGERNRVYGDNYKHFGGAMAACFPNGLTIKSPEDWNRLGIFVQVMSKIARYANSFANGHVDSAHDACVYSAMLEELTREYFGDPT